jgi:hypothetical protein
MPACGCSARIQPDPSLHEGSEELFDANLPARIETREPKTLVKSQIGLLPRTTLGLKSGHHAENASQFREQESVVVAADRAVLGV